MTDIDYTIEGLEKFVKFDGTVKNVDISRLLAPGENFISLVLRVDFEVEKDGVSKTISTVAKRLPPSKNQHLNIHGKAMTNEIKWYSEILELLKDYAKKQGIQGMDFFPKYCGSRYSLDPEVKEADKDSFLLLENLVPQGFKNEDRHEGFHLNATKSILKKIATFHAVPLAIKFAKPELFKVIKDHMESNIPDNPFPSNDKFKPPPGAKGPKDLILDAIKNLSECSPHIDRLKSVLDKQKSPLTYNTLGIEPWNTMLHNDLWINNIMINTNHTKQQKEPLVKIVDFQMCTYGSYAQDLIFFLFTSVNTDIIRKYMDDLLRLYYEEFTSVLIKANVDFDLTYTAFLKEIQRVMFETEMAHILFFTMVVFGEKQSGENVENKENKGPNPMENMIKMLSNLSQQLKDRWILIVTESANRNWI